MKNGYYCSESGFDISLMYIKAHLEEIRVNIITIY